MFHSSTNFWKLCVFSLSVLSAELRRRFDTHIQCFDAKAANKNDILQEWHDYLRRRCEVELEYAKGLERCADRSIERLGRMKSPKM